jgi:hypothetical protein
MLRPHFVQNKYVPHINNLHPLREPKPPPRGGHSLTTSGTVTDAELIQQFQCQPLKAPCLHRQKYH